MASYCYMNGEFLPLEDARISIRTHALHYGTGCFEGIRGYWNDADEQLYVLHVREHFERFHRSARILMIRLPLSVDELTEVTLELLRRNDDRQNVYIRPLAFKAGTDIGPRLHDVRDGLAIFAIPLGQYLATDKGIRCCTSTWRRVDDNGIPARAKVTGLYVNSALARTEASLNGYDEAIVLTHEGHVSEGSAENLFFVSNGALVTPSVSENILSGITRQTVIDLARDEFGMPTVERQVDRSELYVADEVFLCGTGAEITPVREIDNRPIGDGNIGAFTAKLQEFYFAAVRGQVAKYRQWCTPVHGRMVSTS